MEMEMSWGGRGMDGAGKAGPRHVLVQEDGHLGYGRGMKAWGLPDGRCGVGHDIASEEFPTAAVPSSLPRKE